MSGKENLYEMRSSGITKSIAFGFKVAFEAIVAGQGLGLCSDVLVARELRDGRLLRISDIVLPGYGFYFVYRAEHPRRTSLESLLRWMQGQATA